MNDSIKNSPSRRSSSGIKRALSFRSSSGSIRRESRDRDNTPPDSPITNVIHLTDSEDTKLSSDLSVPTTPDKRLEKYLKDFLDAEVKYVSELEGLVAAYHAPLQKNHQLVSLDQFSVVFGKLMPLVSFHKAVIYEPIKPSDNITVCLGDVFVNLSELLVPYVEYSENLPYALGVLHTLKKKVDFVSFQTLRLTIMFAPVSHFFVKVISGDARAGGFTLQKSIEKPPERLFNYPDFLRGLIFHLNEVDADAPLESNSESKETDTGSNRNSTGNESNQRRSVALREVRELEKEKLKNALKEIEKVLSDLKQKMKENQIAAEKKYPIPSQEKVHQLRVRCGAVEKSISESIQHLLEVEMKESKWRHFLQDEVNALTAQYDTLLDRERVLLRKENGVETESLPPRKPTKVVPQGKRLASKSISSGSDKEKEKKNISLTARRNSSAVIVLKESKEKDHSNDGDSNNNNNDTEDHTDNNDGISGSAVKPRLSSSHSSPNLKRTSESKPNTIRVSSTKSRGFTK